MYVNWHFTLLKLGKRRARVRTTWTRSGVRTRLRLGPFTISSGRPRRRRSH